MLPYTHDMVLEKANNNCYVTIVTIDAADIQ